VLGETNLIDLEIAFLVFAAAIVTPLLTWYFQHKTQKSNSRDHGYVAAKLDELTVGQTEIRADVQSVKTDISDLKGDVHDLKSEMREVKHPRAMRRVDL